MQDADTDVVLDDEGSDEGDAQGTTSDEGSEERTEAMIADLKAQIAKAQQEAKDARGQVSGVQRAETQLRTEKAQLEATLRALQEAGSKEYEDTDQMKQAMKQAAEQAPILQGAAEGLKYRYIVTQIRDELSGDWASMTELERANTSAEVDATVAAIKARSQSSDSKLLAELAALKKEMADLREGTHETQPFDRGVRTVTGGANALDSLNDQFNAGQISRAEYEKRATALMRKL